jgi:hypothetical protein
VVHVLRSGSGGYSQGGPDVGGYRGLPGASQQNYVNNWLTGNQGLQVPTVPDTAPLPTRVLDAINSVLPTGWSEARSTTATYWNSSSVESTASSNVLRLDYAAGTPVGYLIEPAATNLLQQSGSQGNAYWFQSGVSVTASNISDPAGGTTASTLNMGNGLGPAGAVWADHVTVSANTVYTFSAWVKSSASGGGSFIRLTTNNATAFNTGISQRFPVTSTWTRISITGNVSNATVANIGFDNRDVAGTYDGTVSGNIDVWGAQLELGSTLTSYIPTTTATVTRGADVASFTLNSLATQLTFTFDNSSTQVITGLTGGSTYNIPTNLNRARILFIDDNTVAGVGSVGSAAGTGAATAVGVSAAASVGSAAGSGAATAVVVGLSATDKYTTISVSADGLTATNPSALSGNHNVRGNTPGSAGRIFEVTATSINNAATSTTGCGLANATQSLSGYVGDPNGIAWFSGGYVEWPGSGFSNNWGTYTTNDVITWELLGSTAKAYKNGVLAGTATSLPSGSLYPVISFGSDSTDSVTVNFGAKAFVNLPAGDTGWNGLTPTGGSVGAAAGSGAATAVGASTAASVGSATGSSTVTATGASLAAAVGSSAGSGTVVATGADLFAGAGSTAGSATVTATGASLFKGVGASAGSATVTATGASIANSVGAAAGSSTVTAVGAAIANSVGSSAGSATVTATGASLAAAVGSTAGSGTVVGTGADLFGGAGATAGSGTATATGASLFSAVGSATGSGTAAGFYAAAGQGQGVSDGTSTVTATGASLFKAVGSSAGTGTVSGFYGANATGVGSSAGTGSAVAEGQSLFSAAGSSAGSALVQGEALAVEAQDFSDDFSLDFSGGFFAEGVAAGASHGSAAVTGVGSSIAPYDFSSDFSADFAAIQATATHDFSADFGPDFATVFQGTIVSGTGAAFGTTIIGATGVAFIGFPAEEPPPVVVEPGKAINDVTLTRRVQPPVANRIYRTAPEMRRSQASIMKRVNQSGVSLSRVKPKLMKRVYK